MYGEKGHMSNPIWAPNASFAAGAVIVDPNGNVQQVSQAGVSGATIPTFAAVKLGALTRDGASATGVVWMLIAILAKLASAPGGLPMPDFLANDPAGLDPNLVLSDIITAFEKSAGRKLQPAQVERLLINLYAYREVLVRNAIQYAAQQNLLAFASFPMLDYLGALLGVTRLPAAPAVVTIQFTLIAVQAQAVVIPAGTLVGTLDGQFQFATDADLTISAGATQGSITATATEAGAAGNGYIAGTIDVQLAPNALVSTAINTAPSAGGADQETDDRLRGRIQAAPSRFSNAGPTGAYKFFALGVDPSIVDVLVTSPAPGQVNVYVLTGPIVTQPAVAPNNVGIANAALLAKVLAALTADTVRPLSDTVSVLAVTEIDYTITGTVELFADADPTATMAAVNAAASQFAIALASRIQRDIVPEEIIVALGSVPGVYRVTLTAPVLTPLIAGQWANCTAIALTQTTATETS